MSMLRVSLLLIGFVLIPGLCSAAYLNLENSVLDKNDIVTPAMGWFGPGPALTANDGWFIVNDEQPTGTGKIKPFLRLENVGSNKTGSEQGFNTDADKVLDNKPGPWTHSLLISNIQPVGYGPVDYYKFMLDINEQNGAKDPFVSLDRLEIYTAAIGNISSLATLQNPAVTHKVYDMAAEGPCQAGAAATCDTSINGAALPAKNALLLDYSDSNGSGSGDMFFYLPVSRLNGNPAGNLYLYLYSQLGATGNLSTTTGKGKSALAIGQDLTSNAGFEEWAVVPEPGSYALLLSLALGGLVYVRHKRSRQSL